MSGMGTIDRMKRFAQSTTEYADEPPLQLRDIFGIGSFVSWFLPIDPLFPDYDNVLGYSMPQRLLREGSDGTSVC